LGVAEAVKEGFDEVLYAQPSAAKLPNALLQISSPSKTARSSTPPLNSGCSKASPRASSWKIAPEAGVSVLEQALRPEDLYSADESSSLRQTAAIFISVRGRKIGGHAKHPHSPVRSAIASTIFSTLLADYVSAPPDLGSQIKTMRPFTDAFQGSGTRWLATQT